LVEMMDRWNFFRSVLSNVEMTLAKTDLDIAGYYVDTLVPTELHHLFHALRAEYELTVPEIQILSGEHVLRGAQPPRRRALELRDQARDARSARGQPANGEGASGVNRRKVRERPG
ncbi:phosphoenolpyruvate carboxylase, partial [Arthrobacter pascens]|uniref:phosphoenolpyruvate carboxylase n=1 Tax=Arthrobacter pascens TaxID=1677 RepID=UPI00196B40D4